MDKDVIVVGAGLAGLVATAELVKAGKTVLLLDQENEHNLGGQAFWSFGGLFLIDSPFQRRMGVKDSLELATQDWFGSANFDRPEDKWPKEWAKAYLEFAAGEKLTWLRSLGFKFFPVVGWAERGGYGPLGHGNSVPRFHITWGTGPGVVEPFIKIVKDAEAAGKVQILHRHRVDALKTKAGEVTGVSGKVLAPDDSERGRASNRTEVASFEFDAGAVLMSTGGIGGNHELVRKHWPKRFGDAPKHMLSGVPAHVDGRGYEIAEAAGASIINPDRMWHYVEGIKNWNPVWENHAIRILPGPSSLWLDATGKQLPPPLWPGFDTLGTLEYLRSTGHDYSWFILSQKVIEKEFALSGSEQNPDLTGKSIRKLLKERLSKGATGPVEAFKEHGEDFVVASNIEELVAGMNMLGEIPVDAAKIRELVEARDREIDNDFTKDSQIMAIRTARNYRGDKLIRTAPPHKFLDPKNGPLIAVKLNILTRKSLGGVETNLDGQVLDPKGKPIKGLYAAGEVNGFGGGGMHGYRALEGTFLGGCLFSGRQAGRGIAKSL